MTVTTRSWIRALQQVAQRDKDKDRLICVVNYVVGENRPWGGYLEGESDPAAELCRHVPALYSALQVAAREGKRPAPGLDPQVCLIHAKHRPRQERPGPPVEGYQGLVLARGSQEEGFPILPLERQAKLDVITAARPVRGVCESSMMDDWEEEIKAQLRKTIEAILLAPTLRHGGVHKQHSTTLVIAPAALCQAAKEINERGHGDLVLQTLVIDALVEAVTPGSGSLEKSGIGEVLFLLGTSPGNPTKDKAFEQEFMDKLPEEPALLHGP